MITIMIMIMLLYSESDKNDTEQCVIRMMIIRTTGPGPVLFLFPGSWRCCLSAWRRPCGIAKKTPTPSR